MVEECSSIYSGFCSAYPCYFDNRIVEKRVLCPHLFTLPREESAKFRLSSCSLLMIVPISYLILKSGVAAPESVFQGLFMCRIIYTNVASTFYTASYQVEYISLFKNCHCSSFSDCDNPCRLFFFIMEPDLGSFVYSSLAGDCVIMLLVYIIGLSKSERLFLIQR